MQAKKNRNLLYVRSGLILKTTSIFIMKMEYANDSGHSSLSKGKGLNILTLLIPYQFELLTA